MTALLLLVTLTVASGRVHELPGPIGAKQNHPLPIARKFVSVVATRSRLRYVPQHTNKSSMYGLAASGATEAASSMANSSSEISSKRISPHSKDPAASAVVKGVNVLAIRGRVQYSSQQNLSSHSKYPAAHTVAKVASVSVNESSVHADFGVAKVLSAPANGTSVQSSLPRSVAPYTNTHAASGVAHVANFSVKEHDVIPPPKQNVTPRSQDTAVHDVAHALSVLTTGARVLASSQQDVAPQSQDFPAVGVANALSVLVEGSNMLAKALSVLAKGSSLLLHSQQKPAENVEVHSTSVLGKVLSNSTTPNSASPTTPHDRSDAAGNQSHVSVLARGRRVRSSKHGSRPDEDELEEMRNEEEEDKKEAELEVAAEMSGDPADDKSDSLADEEVFETRRGTMHVSSSHSHHKAVTQHVSRSKVHMSSHALSSRTVTNPVHDRDSGSKEAVGLPSHHSFKSVEKAVMNAATHHEPSQRKLPTKDKPPARVHVSKAAADVAPGPVTSKVKSLRVKLSKAERARTMPSEAAQAKVAVAAPVARNRETAPAKVVPVATTVAASTTLVPVSDRIGEGSKQTQAPAEIQHIQANASTTLIASTLTTSPVPVNLRGSSAAAQALPSTSESLPEHGSMQVNSTTTSAKLSTSVMAQGRLNENRTQTAAPAIVSTAQRVPSKARKHAQQTAASAALAKTAGRAAVSTSLSPLVAGPRRARRSARVAVPAAVTPAPGRAGERSTQMASPAAVSTSRSLASASSSRPIAQMTANDDISTSQSPSATQKPLTFDFDARASAVIGGESKVEDGTTTTVMSASMLSNQIDAAFDFDSDS